MNLVPRDLGQAAEVSSGGGTRGMLAEFGWLIGLTAIVIALISLFFASMAGIAVAWVSPATEAAWFEKVSAELQTSEPDDPELRQRLDAARRLLTRLMNQPGAPELEISLVLVDDVQINAFAFPGGVIGLTRGLLESLDDEVGLAFVLAHEMGHFKNRDHLQRFIRNSGRTAVLAILFGRGAGVATEADRWMGLDYSRDQERAADQFGLQLVYETFGHVQGTSQLFHLLDANEKLPSWAYMFATHPDTDERLKDLRDRAAELKRGQE